MTVLSTSDLTIGYGNKTIAKELNLALDSGQLIGLIGQNGVGKSTLLKTLSGFQKPISGEISLFGIPLRNLKPIDRAKKLAVVLTEKPMAQNLTVLELISLGRHPYSGWLGQLRNEDQLAVERALDQCQIHYLVTKRLYELSDGQMQKVMIARALAQETDLILLDEPTSHLDLRNKVEVLDLLSAISKTGKSILISTHEISLSAKVCDAFWCMDFGEPMMIGSPTKLIKDGDIRRVLHLSEGVL